MQSERVMITLVAFVSVSTAAVHYLLTTPTTDPSIIAVQGAILAFMTQPVYFFIVKPVSKWLSDTLAAAAAFKAEVRSAAEPAGGLTPGGTMTSSTNTTIPVPAPSKEINDFTN